MRSPERYDPWALLPVLAGLCWLNAGDGWGLIFSIWPGLLLTGSGMALLLMPGDVRITRMMAVGALLGVLLGLFFWTFDDGALLGGLLSVASFLLAGREALRLMAEVEDVPAAPRELGIYARTAIDEALLGYFSATASIPSGGDVDECIEALKAQRAAVERLGFERDASELHGRPEAPEHVEWQTRRTLGQDFRVLHFDSEFSAHPEIPGADRYMAYESNRQTAAWVFEHEGEDRPWLLCVHGYRMGHPLLDFTLFPPKLLHERYGLNLLMPVLPLHGPRRAGRRSGDQFLDGDLRDLFHAECQTLWDLRRHMAWLRARGAQRIGALGFSLGGYNTALLSAYEQLDFAIAGIPISDLPSVLWPSLPDLHQRYFAHQGAQPELLRDALRPVSPLARPSALPVQRRFVFGGLADRLVPPDQVARLGAHWQVDPQWYPGGHVSFRGSGIVTRVLGEAMQVAEWPRR